MRHLLLGLCLLLALAPAQADEKIWNLLRGGGQVLLIRHASTDPGVGDPDGFKLGECSTQRNLSAAGRQEARRLGELLRQQKVPIGAVVSSPWCRCVDTAQLAFSRVDKRWSALSNLFGRSGNAQGQIEALRPRIGAFGGKDNLVLVTHGSTAMALTGISPQQAEVIVLTPRGGERFELAGRVSIAPR